MFLSVSTTLSQELTNCNLVPGFNDLRISYIIAFSFGVKKVESLEIIHGVTVFTRRAGALI